MLLIQAARHAGRARGFISCRWRQTAKLFGAWRLCNVPAAAGFSRRPPERHACGGPGLSASSAPRGLSLGLGTENQRPAFYCCVAQAPSPVRGCARMQLLVKWLCYANNRSKPRNSFVLIDLSPRTVDRCRFNGNTRTPRKPKGLMPNPRQ